MSTILEQVKQAIIDGDEDAAQAHAGEALQQGVSPLAVVKEAIVPGIERTGELWKDNVYFMPDVVLSTEAFKAAMNVVAAAPCRPCRGQPGKISHGRGCR